jgi:hypothetical protein
MEGYWVMRKQGFAKRTMSSRLLFAVFCSLLIVLFPSCKTAPAVPNAVINETEFIPLESGAMVYLFADVKAARPILELMPILEMNNKQTRQMLDRTDTAVAAFYPTENGRRFQLAAWGKYPSFRAGLGFGMSKSWKKRRSPAGYSYWYSSSDRLSISMDAKQAFVTSWVNDTGGDSMAAGQGIENPDGLGEFRRGAILSCWLEDPGPRINRIFEELELPMQLPAERIFVSVSPAAGQKYEAIIRMRLSNASQARALVTLFSLARNFMGSPAQADDEEMGLMDVMISVLFANPPVLDGRDINLKTAVLGEKEIALLLEMFSVY